jgi:glyoxylase-like metal-dependent hydrolase (beta-lactamase superfamily II)
VQVSPSVRAVQVPDENPMHPMATSIYIVGRDQVLTIDSGEALERYQWMLRGYLAAIEKAEIALAGITHHHLDHSGNLKWIRELYKADVLVHDTGVPLLEGKLPDTGVQLLHEGQSIDLGGGTRVQVLATPGHSVDSVCYYIEDEGVLFTGDTLLGFGTTTVWELGPYMETLRRLQQYIEHREMRERQILAVLGEGGEHTSWDIMLRLYPDIDTRLRRAANNNVETHLKKLQAEGRLKVYEGVPKEQTAEEKAQAEEHARLNAEIKEKAKKIEEEERRAALAAQENPPTERWEVMPKYELVGKPGE